MDSKPHQSDSHCTSDSYVASAFDYESVLARLRGSTDVFVEIAQIFLATSQDLLAELHDAAADGNASKLERFAHTLKGSARALGADRLIHTASQLERIAREPGFADLQTALRDVRREFECVESALRQRLQTITHYSCPLVGPNP